MMATPQQKQKIPRWTPEEDNKLVAFMTKHPGLRSWKGIAALAGLPEYRTDKSCWERWRNHLGPDVKKEKFSEEEDDTIFRLHWVYEKSWSFIAEHHLGGRPPNAIKNRWNNHLKKRFANMSKREKELLYAKLLLLTDDETSDHSVPGDVLEALMAEFTSLIQNVDPNASSDS